MQSDAELDSEEAGCHHRDPRRKISVVHMDMLRARSSDQQGEVGSEPGMQQRAQPPPKRFSSLRQHATKKVLEYRKLQEAQQRSLDQQLEAQRLQAQGLGGKGLQVGVKDI